MFPSPWQDGGIGRAMQRFARLPAAREDLEAVGLSRSFDDFDRPLPRSSDGIAEFVARIAAIGKNMAQPGEALPHSLEDIDRAIAVPNIGGMHE